MDSFFRSNRLIPIKLNVSVTSVLLMDISSGASVAILLEMLTSRSHGFRSESISTSKPYSS